MLTFFFSLPNPQTHRSTSNKLFVKFVSDGSVQKAGFSATFMKEVDECEHMDHGCEHECINTLGGYECACYIGYELHSDKKSCESKCVQLWSSFTRQKGDHLFGVCVLFKKLRKHDNGP